MGVISDNLVATSSSALDETLDGASSDILGEVVLYAAGGVAYLLFWRVGD